MKWTDTNLGSALHDGQGTLIAKLRPLGAGGVTAQWCNGMEWDVSDQLKMVKTQRSRWFRTIPEAKAAVASVIARLPESSAPQAEGVCRRSEGDQRADA